jgi:hypothetical protein
LSVVWLTTPNRKNQVLDTHKFSKPSDFGCLRSGFCIRGTNHNRVHMSVSTIATLFLSLSCFTMWRSPAVGPPFSANRPHTMAERACGGCPSSPTPTADLHAAGSQRRWRLPTRPLFGARSLPAQISDGGAELEEQEVRQGRSRGAAAGGAGAQRQEEQKARRGRSRGATMGGEGDPMVGGAGRLMTGDSAALAFDASIFLLAATVASRLCSSLGASSRGGCPCSRTRRRLPTMPTTGSHYRPRHELLPPVLPSGRPSLLPNRTCVARSTRASRGGTVRQAEQRTTARCPGQILLITFTKIKSSALEAPAPHQLHPHQPIPVTMPPIAGI